jgi:hypothetical protein
MIEALSQKPTANGTPMMSRPGFLTQYEHIEFQGKGLHQFKGNILDATPANFGKKKRSSAQLE